MKRDMEKVRSMLFDFSEGKGKTSFTTNDREYIYHLEIMREAGLITFEETRHKSGMLLMEPPKLTWEGNDYLDAISNEGIWDKTKETIKGKGMELSSVPLDIVVELAKIKIKSTFGIE